MKKRYVVAGILAAAGLICGGIAYYQYYQDAHAGQEYEKIKEKVVTEEPKKPEETQKSTVEIPIDFQTLQNMNPDIYAWITWIWYSVFENEITLPLHTKLTDEEVEYVIEKYCEIVKEYL